MHNDGAINGSFTNDGTLNLTGSIVAAPVTNNSDGMIIGPGTISGAFANSGTLNVPNGTTKVGSFTNNGVIEMAGSAANLGPGGTVTNVSVIEGFGKISDTIVNNGTIQPINGSLTISGNLTNSSTGLISAGAGTNLLVSSGLNTNAGLLSLTGGIFDNGGHALNNTGQITGYGTLRTGGLTNNGSFTLTGGTSTISGPVTNAANQTLYVKYQPAIFTGNITNNGNITVTSTTITYTGTYTGNNYYSDPSTNVFQNNVTILAGGSMTGSSGDIFNFSNGLVVNNGTFNNGGSLVSAEAISNTGTFVQAGAQTWSVGATFTNSGAATFSSDAGSASASTLALINNAGTTTLASTQHLASLTINGGKVAITSGTARTNALALAGSNNSWTSDLDLGANKLVVEALTNKSATLGILQNEAFYGATHSTGITSSALPPHTEIAVIDNGALATPFSVFGGIAVDNNSLLLAPELLGDTNIDGRVDLNDLNTVLNNLGTLNTGWVAGNFDGAATIDLNDLNDVLNQLGTTYANSSSVLAAESLLASPSNVPEPASLLIASVGALALTARRRRPHQALK